MLTILQASTLLALLAAGFTLATAIGGRVIGERRRIGLLRAIGVTPAGVTVPAGRPLRRARGHRRAARPRRRLSASPPGDPRGHGDGAGRAGSPARPALPRSWAGRCSPCSPGWQLATAVPAGRGRLAPPSRPRSRSGAATPPPAPRGWPAPRAARCACRRSPILGAKDAFARPTRAVLTVASLALAAVLVVCTMGFEATMDRVGTDSALRAQPWDLRVDTEGVAAQARPRPPELERNGDITAVARLYATRARRLQEPRAGSSAACSTPCAVAWPRSRSPSARCSRAPAPGETTLGRGALEALHARIGDPTVHLSAHGIPFSAAGRRPPRRARRRRPRRRAPRWRASPRAAIKDIDDPAWVVQLRPGADRGAVERAIVAAGDGRVHVAVA